MRLWNSSYFSSFWVTNTWLLMQETRLPLEISYAWEYIMQKPALFNNVLYWNESEKWGALRMLLEQVHTTFCLRVRRVLTNRWFSFLLMLYTDYQRFRLQNRMKRRSRLSIIVCAVVKWEWKVTYHNRNPSFLIIRRISQNIARKMHIIIKRLKNWSDKKFTIK